MKRRLLLSLALFSTVTVYAQNYIPDSSFYFSGVRNYNVYSNIDRSFGVAVQPDGKFVAVGLSKNPGTTYFELCFSRFNPDGSLDNSFGSGGVRKVSMGAQQSIGGQAPKVRRDSEGRFVACNAGNSGGGLDMMICRLDSTGNIDNSFSGNGVLFVDMAGSGNFPDLGSAIDFDAAGNIWIAGVTRNGGTPLDNQFAVVKVKPNGTLDPTFDIDGKKLFNLTSGSEFGLGIAVQSDSKIVVGGTAGGGMYLFRIDSTGVLDLSFNATGTRLTSIGSSSAMLDMELDSLERIVIYGSSGSTALGMARVQPNGNLDSTFAVNGVKTLSIGSLNSEPGEIEIVPGNKILLCGTVNTTTGADDFFVARLKENGSLDSTFNGVGYTSNPVAAGLSNDQAAAMGVFSDGKIIVSGTTVFSSAVNEDMAFLKLKPVAAITGISSVNNETLELLYPNPAHNFITVNCRRELMVTISNMLGQVLINTALHSGINTIDVSSLPDGTYILNDAASGSALRFIKH